MNYTPQGHIQIMDWPTLQEAIRKEPGTFHVYLKQDMVVIGTATLETTSFAITPFLNFEVETMHKGLKFVKVAPEVLNN